MKTINQIIAIIMVLFLFGCSNNTNQDTEHHNEESETVVETTDTKEETAETITEDFHL